MAAKKSSQAPSTSAAKPTLLDRFLSGIERAGNALPDPALLFIICLSIVWVLSWIFGGGLGGQATTFIVPSVDPATGALVDKQESVRNLLSGVALTDFLARLVTIFTSFHPLGVVLVALLGVGVAEASGFINAGLKSLLGFTPKRLLTPMVILVAIVSHTAADAGYVLVIPLGAAIFYAAGRHPLAGIAAAFAGVSGGFSANFLISGIDPMLQGITQAGAQIIDPAVSVNPLCNWYFTGASSLVIMGLGWFITDRVIEPRLKATEVDGDPADMPKLELATKEEKRGLFAGLLAMAAGIVVLVLVCLPEDSAMREPRTVKITLKSGEVVSAFASTVKVQTGLVTLQPTGGPPRAIQRGEIIAMQASVGGQWQVVRFSAVPARTSPEFDPTQTGEVLVFETKGVSNAPPRVVALEGVQREEQPGSLTDSGAGLMKSIVPLIMLLFLIPGIVHGYVSGTFKSHRDIIKGMSKSMSSMGYYLVMAFCAALFIDAFNQSGLGKWLAVSGADVLKSWQLPTAATIVGIIFLTFFVNLLIGSASAKWALLAPIFVPMLMRLGISPDFTQAAYRIGDSTANIITPLMPYFPLVVAFSQRYTKKAGIGTVISLMLPYSIVFVIGWTLFLIAFWQLGIPLGVNASYEYLPAGR